MNRCLRNGVDADGREQAGGKQRRIRLVGVDVGFGVLLRAGLQVTDEAIGPEVGDVNGEQIRAGVERGVDANQIRPMPDRAELLAIDGDGGDLAHVAEVEPDGVTGA